MRIYYQLTTIDSVIVSINNASANNQGSLDYIPGSAILGALAAQYYPQLSKEESWNAFQNSQTCFSPAYPVEDGEICLPVPASWHYEKGENSIVENQFDPEIISNHACPTFDRNSESNSNKQFKQCREGYVNSKARSVKVKQSMVTKTAIDSQKGKAKEGQLFSYRHIDAGQTFAGWIDCKDEALAEKFKKSMQSTLRIGRSRNSEFGRVKSQLVRSGTKSYSKQPNNKMLIIWCLSDCEMFGKNGLPTFTPELSVISERLNGTLNKSLSYIRTSRISRFNQKRMGLDSEQLLIAKGSVLVYDLQVEGNLEAIDLLQEKGMGRNRQQGLGWISINPQWATTPTLSSNELFSSLSIERLKKLNKSSKNGKSSMTKVNSVLTSWLAEKLTSDKTVESRTQEVEMLLEKIVNAYSNARSYNNIYLSNEAGPSSNQWRRISDKVRNNNSSNWTQGVFDGDSPICKADNDELGWGIEWSEGNKPITFAYFSKTALQNVNILTMRSFLDKLCRYDLSTAKGLKAIKEELRIAVVKENNDKETSE